MDKLNFYTVPEDYAAYLCNAENKKRGFSRVPNLNYGNNRKQKFLCGIVLNVNNNEYYVPVSSFKIQMPDNFLIRDKNNKPVSSLRFNYMFPVPMEIVKVRNIKNEPDNKYRTLLAQELQYCIKNQDEIRRLAFRTYKRVLLGKNPTLVNNSCDFKLLEQKCREYTEIHNKE